MIRVMKLIPALLAALSLTALAGRARADGIQTFGGQTFYQDAYPGQYDLCLTVDSNYHLVSDYCTNASNQNLTFYNAHITYTVSWYNYFLHRWGTTTYYATNHGSYVSMDTFTGSAAQLWTLEGSNLRSDAGGGCMDVYWGNTGNGARIDVTTCNGTQAQWFWAPSAQSVSLYNYGSRGCLTDTGSAINISGCNYTNSQKWVLTNNQQLQNLATGRCLQDGPVVTGSTCSYGTQWNAGQEWTSFTQVYGFFQSYDSGACLTSSGGAATMAACSATNAGNTSQFWVEQ